jgi:asparagine synthase (glutamine-hydrolysing)
MCGIVGLVCHNPSQHFSKMFENIAHRGPDDFGTFITDKIALGHQRLSIQDLSQNGHQPMFSKDERFLILFNGEIYNHWELRSELELKYNFNSNSDTETILNGFLEYNVDLFNKLNGIFVICIFDTITGELIIARDQFGVKPLYYQIEKNYFSFSSELKAIINKSNKGDLINYESIFNYIYFLWSPGEHTPLVKYKKLLAGHYIRVNINELDNFNIFKYYEIPFNTTRFDKSETELINELESKIVKAIDRQLLSDVPIGFFLSGGLDSSLIVAIAKKIRPELETTCFTINTSNFNNSEGFSDDLFYAKIVANYLDVKLEIINADVNIVKDFDKMIWHLDEPQADPAPLNVFNICKRARELGYKVLIGGTAGDDLFSGYRRHQQIYLNKKIKFIPLFFKRFLHQLIKLLPTKYPNLRRLNKYFSYFESSTNEKRLVSQFGWLNKIRIFNLFTKSSNHFLKNFDPSNTLIHTLSFINNNEDDLNKLLFLEMKYFLTDHNLNYTDKMSMAVGVEVRVPFLDKELVEFSTQIPVRYKMKGICTKYILKKVAEKYLPKEVIYRSKAGFGAPVREWIVKDLDPLIQKYLSPESINKRGIFNSDSVWQLINDNKNNKIDASYSIWALLSIESWFRQFHDTKD